MWLAVYCFQYAEKTEYLGVTLSVEGVSDEKTIEWLCVAEARIRQLKKAGMHKPRLGSNRIRRVYRALVQPTWTYALHVTPFSDEVERRALAFIESATLWAFPKLPRASRVRARHILALPDADVVRWQQQLALASRLQTIAEKALEEGAEDSSTLEQDAQSTWKLPTTRCRWPTRLLNKCADGLRWKTAHGELAKVCQLLERFS